MDSDTLKVWKLAASGDREAFAALGQSAIAAALEPDVDDTSGDEMLAEAIVFARLAALRGGPIELLELCGLFHLRAGRLDERSQRMEALGDPVALPLFDKAQDYRERAEALYVPILNHPDPEGALLLMRFLSDAADQGNEMAATRLQQMMDCVGKERAIKLTNALREREDA